jgi:hypothetical protein
LPCDFLAFSSSILDKNLFDCCLESVDVAEIQLFKIIITVNCGTNASSFQNDIFILTVLDDEVENIVEFRGIVSVANDIELQFFSRFQKRMLNFGFEDGYFLSGKGMEFSFDFRIVNDGHFQGVIFQDFNLTEIEFFRSDSHFWAI